MDRRTKIIIGIIIGSLGYIVSRNTTVQIDRLETDLDAYGTGWNDAVKWHKSYHEAHHPDCSRCPH